MQVLMTAAAIVIATAPAMTLMITMNSNNIENN